MIEQALYEQLTQDVTEVNGRVFPIVMPPKTKKPAIVYAVVEYPSISVSCEDSKIYREWELHIYDKEYLATKEVKQSVVAALKTFGANNIVAKDIFVQDAEIFGQEITFTTGKRRK